MKLVINIGNVATLLSPEQLERLIDLLDGSEVLNNKYIGGNHGSNYLELIEPIDIRRSLDLRVMPTMQYDGMKAITVMHLEGEKKK